MTTFDEKENINMEEPASKKFRFLQPESRGSCSSESVCSNMSSSTIDTSSSSSSSGSAEFDRTLTGNSESLFRPGELTKGSVEVPIHSNMLFVNLPQRIVSALGRYGRIGVHSDGRMHAVPFVPDEFANMEPRTSGGINPLQRRVLNALEKSSGITIERDASDDEFPADLELEANDDDDDKENTTIDSDITSKSQTESIATMSASASESGTAEANECASGDHDDVLQKELLSAIGLSAGQIDRLSSAPVWAPMPKKKSQVENDECSEDEGQPSSDNPEERHWEVAAILRPQLDKKDPTKKEYLVVWKDWPWHDQWSLSPECFDGGEHRMVAADTRERLVSQMAAYMRHKDKQAFDEMFPTFDRRHDFTSWYRVQLRLIEQSINDELEDLGMAPIYVENWTKDERALINVKYLTRCALSVLNYREVKAVGRSLRLQYPEDGAGCDCKDGVCTPACPCIRLMGRDQIRMRSSGRVDVDKLAEATTVECGPTCSCTIECPSRFAERGRKVPLVIMYTTTKGWSVFAPQIIPSGAFLGVYTGEIIPLCSAISQGMSTSYQFTNIHQIPGTKQYVVDASRMGNETRYFNHACGDVANLKAVSLLSRGNLLTNNMLFFTKRMISKGEELTFSYRGKDMEEQKSGIRCLCTPGCQNRL